MIFGSAGMILKREVASHYFTKNGGWGEAHGPSKTKARRKKSRQSMECRPRPPAICRRAASASSDSDLSSFRVCGRALSPFLSRRRTHTLRRVGLGLGQTEDIQILLAP